MSDCGWFPVNRKLLEHKSLFDDTVAPIDTSKDVTQPTSNSTTSTITLNVDDGMGGCYSTIYSTKELGQRQGKRQPMNGDGVEIRLSRT